MKFKISMAIMGLTLLAPVAATAKPVAVRNHVAAPRDHAPKPRPQGVTAHH